MAHPDFKQPFIDLEEGRLQPFPHHYVHGGFRGNGNETMFSLYLPPKEKYRGRFLQYLQGGGGGSDKALSGERGGRNMNWLWELAFEELGAYLVESNQGHTAPGAADLATELVSHVASSESARFGRDHPDGHAAGSGRRASLRGRRARDESRDPEWPGGPAA